MTAGEDAGQIPCPWEGEARVWVDGGDAIIFQAGRTARHRPGSLGFDDCAREIDLKLSATATSAQTQFPFPDRSEAKWRDLGGFSRQHGWHRKRALPRPGSLGSDDSARDVLVYALVGAASAWRTIVFVETMCFWSPSSFSLIPIARPINCGTWMTGRSALSPRTCLRAFG